MVLFRLHGGEYKDFSKYSEGLRRGAERLQKELPAFRLRLYIDDTVATDNEVMAKLHSIRPSIEFVRFSCPPYLKDNKFHKGLFGTLMRFLPLFDGPDHVVLVSDADFSPYWRSIRIYKTIAQNPQLHAHFRNSYLFFCGRIFHHNVMTNTLIRQVYSPQDGVVLPYCLADSVMGYKRLDKKILSDFMKKANVNKGAPMTNYLRETRLTSRFTDDGYVFGVDEYFINEIVMPHLSQNGMSFGVTYTFSVMHSLFFFLHDSRGTRKHLTKASIQCLTKMFRVVLNIDGDVDVYETLQQLDQLFTQASDIKTEEEALIIYRIYLFYDRLLKRPHHPHYDEIFPPWFLKMVTDPCHLPYYRGECYRFYNPSIVHISYGYSIPHRYVTKLKEELLRGDTCK